MSLAAVILAGVTKYFGNVRAVEDLSLNISGGEFLVLLGPSGCGKTTTMRMVAGLEAPTRGEIYIGDDLVNDLPPKDRDVAMVFQSYALYPHMTVYDNMAFPLKMRKYVKEKIREKVLATADLLQIGDLLQRKPKQLSGGQQQRVALGRAVVREPRVFLMDEPLSNLDAKLRVYMRAELKILQKRIGITTIYVTHDQVEAMTMSDRIALMNAGILQQLATPDEMYNHPESIFTAGFVGSPPMNFLSCSFIEKNGKALLDGGTFKLDITEFKDIIKSSAASAELALGLRPEDITVLKEHSPGAIEVYVYVVEPLGSEIVIDLKLGHEIVRVRAPPGVRLKTGETVYFTFNRNKMHLFDKTGKAII